MDLDSADTAQPASLVAELGPAAAAIDGQAQAAETVQPGVQPLTAVRTVDWKAEAHDLVDFTTGMFFPLYPRLATVWTAERCASLETRLAVVLEKHKLDMGALLGKWGPEIMLAATIAPAVVPTMKALKDDLAELRAQAAEKARAAPPAGQPAAQPPPAVRTAVRDQAAGEGTSAPPPPDATRLHAQA